MELTSEMLEKIGATEEDIRFYQLVSEYMAITLLRKKSTEDAHALLVKMIGDMHPQTVASLMLTAVQTSNEVQTGPISESMAIQRSIGVAIFAILALGPKSCTDKNLYKVMKEIADDHRPTFERVMKSLAEGSVDLQKIFVAVKSEGVH